MTIQPKVPAPVTGADEAVNIALNALRQVYGSNWGFDIRQCNLQDGCWVVDIYVVFFGVRRITVNPGDGSIQKIESVGSA